MKPLKSAIAVAMLSAMVLTGCSSADTTENAGAAIDCAPSDGPVNLSFTSWIPGIESVVDVWNKANPEIQVKVQTGPNGNSGTYQNFFNQIKAGDAPDLGQIEYDAKRHETVDRLLADADGAMYAHKQALKRC